MSGALKTIIKHTRFDLPHLAEREGLAVIELGPDDKVPHDFDGDALVTGTNESPNLADLLKAASNIGWIHTLGTGMEKFPIHRVRPDQVLTCARGSSAIPISEWVLAHMLAHTKELPSIWIDEAPDGWWQSPTRIRGLHGATVVILGLGAIGTEVARRCLPFGMRILAVRRSGAPSPLDGVEITSDLLGAVSDADHLVVAAPSTPATHHIVDSQLLCAAKPSIHVVNVSRGELIDEAALRHALDDGQVARASLDTVEPEPLPAGHWMFDHPKVRLTPHISWIPGGNRAMVAHLLENVDRWLAGRPLDGVVDREAGY